MHPFVIATARLGKWKPELDPHHTPLTEHIHYYHNILLKNGGYEWNLKNYPALLPHELEIVRAIDAAERLWRERKGSDSIVYRDLCVEMTILISWYLHWQGHWDLRVRLCKRITDIAELGELSSTHRIEVGNLYVDRGWIHLSQGDLDAAAHCADAGERWLRGSGDEIFARELDGQIAFALKDYAKARALFVTLRDAVESNRRVWFIFSYRLADTLLAAGDKQEPDKLLLSLGEAIRSPKLEGNEIIEDVHARILYRLSLQRLAKGDDLPALDLLKQTVKMFEQSGIATPERAAAGMEIACLLAKLGRYEECRLELDGAVAVKSQMPALRTASW